MKQRFLETLFSDLGDGFIELRGIHPQQGARSKFFTSVEEVKEHWLKLEEGSKRFDIYFGVCPRLKKQGDKSAVKRVSALWADVDGKDFAGGKEEALAKIKSFPVAPTIVVETGNGYHCYWLLVDPVIINAEADIIRVEGFLKGIAKALNADLRAAEIARVLRLPGTMNHKNPDELKPVTVLEHDGTRKYQLADFEQFLENQSTDHEPKNPDGWIGSALLNLKEGNRNSTFASITGRLHHNGWKSEDILAILEPHALRCSFPLDELKRVVNSICRYPNNKPYPSTVYIVEETETESFPVISVSDFLAQGKREIEWVVDGILPKEAIGILAGPGGHGKSWTLLDLAIDVSQGRPWLNVFPTLPGTVLYIDEESSAVLLYDRLIKLLTPKGLLKSDVDMRLSIQIGLRLTDEKSVSKLHNLLTLHKPQLVIIDALTRVHDADENSAREIAKIFHTVKMMVKEFKCSFLFADHQRKAGASPTNSALLVRGSTDKVNAVDAVFSLNRKGGLLCLEHSKARFSEMMLPFMIKMEKAADGIKLSHFGPAGKRQEEEQLDPVGHFLKSVLNTED